MTPFNTGVHTVKKMKLFIDTHNRDLGTFQADITPAKLSQFYEGYQQACAEEGVIPLKIYTGLEAGRAFCLTLAQTSDAVERAHERAGLPYDSISEVTSVSPGDLFFQPSGI